MTPEKLRELLDGRCEYEYGCGIRRQHSRECPLDPRALLDALEAKDAEIAALRAKLAEAEGRHDRSRTNLLDENRRWAAASKASDDALKVATSRAETAERERDEAREENRRLLAGKEADDAGE